MAILFNINGLFAIDSTGAMELGGAAGASTYVLMSNGAGNANSWYDVQSKFAEYLPLTGGTLTGNLAINGSNSLTVGGVTTLNAALTGTSATFVRDASGYALRLDSGDATTDNDLRFAKGGTDYAAIQVAGPAASDFQFYVNDGTNWINTLTFARADGQATFTKLVSGITPTAAANFATKAYVDAHPGSGGTVTSVSGTGTVSGITLTGTVTSTGNLTLGGTISASITNISNASNWWNNFGQTHSTRTGFDASTASYDFGWRYIQGNTNGPGTGGAQFYSAYVGLGSEYPATGSGSYGMYLAIDRNTTNPYLSIRYNEANNLGTWKRISAGTADILTTARTIAGVSFNGSANISLNNNAITNGAGYTTNTGTVTSLTLGNGLTGSSLTGPIPNILMSGSYTGTFTATDTIQGYGLTSQNKRGNSGKVPQGHYAGGETVWEMDNTWSSQQLADYFNASVSNVYWTEVADAPGGNCIYINGGVNVGGVYGSGFPYLPVETNSQQQADYYMEVWIQNVGTNQTHYMGSNEFNQSFSSLGGNPGSYGYWVMANSNPGTGWTKYSAYIGGFSSSTVGMFELGTKYWTPMALLNYGAGSGTRACRISGWKVIKVQRAAKINMSGNDIIKIGDLIGEVGLDIKVDNGTTNAITIDNVGSTTFSGYTYFPDYLFHAGDTNTRIGFTTGTVTIRGDSGITLDGPTTTNANFIGTTATFSGLTNLLGGSKIVVQNGTDGGTSRGIFMWTNTDTNWGIYMSTPGSTNNIAGGTAPAGLNGETSHSIRFRIASNASNGFIWENHNNAALMSLKGSTGDLVTSSSMQAPIFYDSLNTAYYIDPSSDISAIFAGSIGINNTSPINTAWGSATTTKQLSITGANYGVLNLQGSASSVLTKYSMGVGGSYFYMAYDNIASRHNIRVNSSGNVDIEIDVRAPIFYDKNNTAYYGDFSSYSSMRGVAIRGDLGTSDIDNQIFFYGSTGSTTSAIGFKNGGQFANPTGNGDGWNTMLTMDTDGRGWVFRRGTGGTNFTSAYTAGWILNNGIFQANASMRAPIFYDSANTAYYGDFAGTSQLNVLNCAGTLTVTGAGGVVAPKFTDYNNGSFYLDPSNTGTSLNVAGTGIFAGDVVAYSDKKLKTNIKTLDGSKVLKMRGVSFDRIDTGNASSGVIAQEIQEIAPELVNDKNGTLAVAYGNLTGYLIEAIKKQQKQIDELTNIIKKLK